MASLSFKEGFYGIIGTLGIIAGSLIAKHTFNLLEIRPNYLNAQESILSRMQDF
mgnify:CR=1 FL=1